MISSRNRKHIFLSLLSELWPCVLEGKGVVQHGVLWMWSDAYIAHRGMFTLSTVHPLPTSPLFIPTLNLNGRAPPRNASVGLDHVDKPPDMVKWAEFHNGVAAGLQLAHGSSKV